MQESFNKMSALRAAQTFKRVIAYPKKETFKSNKTVVLYTMISYFGECSNTKLKKVLPSATWGTSLEILLNKGYVTKRRDGREVYYKYSSSFGMKADGTSQFDENVLYLFANCLMNMDIYIKKYNINSWNMLAFMLEVALNQNFTTGIVKVTDKNMCAITGKTNNKLNARKLLEKAGVISPVTVQGGRSINGEFVLNKNAYIMSY